MTNQPSNKLTTKVPTVELSSEVTAQLIPKKVGHFIVVNTPTIKGVRLNLEKVRTYGKAGRNIEDVQVAWDNGTSSTFTFGDEQKAYQFLEVLDGHCL